MPLLLGLNQSLNMTGPLPLDPLSHFSRNLSQRMTLSVDLQMPLAV